MINLARHPGNYDVLIYPPDGKTIRPRNGMRADASASLLRQMQAILGDGNVKAEEKQGSSRVNTLTAAALPEAETKNEQAERKNNIRYDAK